MSSLVPSFAAIPIARSAIAPVPNDSTQSSMQLTIVTPHPTPSATFPALRSHHPGWGVGAEV